MDRRGKVNWLRTIWACFAASQAGALVICIGLFLKTGPINALLEGAYTWLIGQIVIMPFTLLFLPIGLLFRVIMCRLFHQYKLVAMTTGALIGMSGIMAVASLSNNSIFDIVFLLALGAFGGQIGGWVWWRIERSVLENEPVDGTQA